MKPVQWDRFKQAMDRFRDDGGIVLVVDDDEDARKRIRAPLSATTGRWWRRLTGSRRPIKSRPQYPRWFSSISSCR